MKSVIKITLISTRHENLGICNSDELYRIIENIKPEVIFEEMPPSNFDLYYNSKTRSNLESDTINKYIQNYKIKHVPVDIDIIPSDGFFQDYKFMIERIEGLADINGFNFRQLMDNNKSYIKKYGFDYLNSTHSIKMNNKINESIENGLKKLNNVKLFRIFKLWRDIHENRENTMLDNIYTYSETNNFEKAIFTLGGAHRNSIIQKVSKYKSSKKVDVNWVF